MPRMRGSVTLIILLLISFLRVGAQEPQGVRVEVVATASEYVPKTTTISHPGHAYTDCHGSTSYFGDFRGFEDSSGRIRGDVSGAAKSETRCQTTFTPPTETSLTHYDRVNYTIAKSDQSLYLLSCTQHWKPTRKERGLGVFVAGTVGSGKASDTLAQNSVGTWTECPAFVIGGKYALSLGNTSDAHLEGASGGKPFKLDYLSSAALSVPGARPPSPSGQSEAPSTGATKVHITSAPSGGDIYVDGQFVGNAPSDLVLAAGEHVVKVTLGGKEWTRTAHIIGGEIQLHAELPGVTVQR